MNTVEARVSGRSFNWPLASQSFYFWMAVLISLLVISSFSLTVGENLIYPTPPRPALLYIHAIVFFVWVALFLTQTALIGNRNLRLHRKLGLAGAYFGAVVPVIGVLTTLVMADFNETQLGTSRERVETFLIIPLNDMLCFTPAFALAVWWRKRPEFHRRFMFIATCTMTAAAFARFPFMSIPALRFHAGVDLLILLGVARDLIKDRRIHPVYLYAVPLLLAVQVVVMTLYLTQSQWWREIARGLIGLV